MSALQKCRLCLKPTEAFLNLFKGDYIQIIQELTSLRISETDGYPQVACIGCIYEIQQASKTRKRILDCHKQLVLLSNIISESADNPKEPPDTDGVNADYYLETDVLDIPSQVFEVPENVLAPKIYDLNIPFNSIFIVEEVKTVEQSIRAIEAQAKRVQLQKKPPKRKEQKVSENKDKSIRKHFDTSNLPILSEQKAVEPEVDNEMKKILYSHTTSVSRICELCDRCFEDNATLLTHMCVIHEVSMFKCDACRNIYFSKLKLEEHKNNEHGDHRKSLGIKYSYSCKFSSCQNQFQKGGKNNKKFHSFPRDPQRAALWRKICNISPKTNTTNFRVCADHFDLSDYNNRNDPKSLNYKAFPKPSNAS